ncbi:MAG: choice-of-anchor Q domain-containing protein, partial [Raineya sp.]|nr:choice-of-anchor Q domain-containing protein [Raineya sp.]
YEIFVNAQSKEVFENISILGKDSLLIIISARIRNRNQDELYQAYDSLMFELPNGTQNVKLLTWAENVNVVSGILPCNITWTKQRPYLLKGNVEVPLGCMLTIQPATKIYAFNNAQMEIKGTLNVQGKADSNVVFRYFRREAGFENLLGAWQGIRIRKSSTNNQIRFARIANTRVAVFVDSSEVLLEGTTLQSASEATLVGVKSKVFLRNCLLNNAILRLFQATNGGEYELVHCTLANYEFFFNRQEEEGSVFFNEAEAEEMKIRLFNNIFWGNLRDEVLFVGEKINLSAANNIFRTQRYREVLNVNNNLLNVPSDSLFRSPRRFDYRLPSTSPALGKGISTSITTDILGKTRKNPPDIGAFERQ